MPGAPTAAQLLELADRSWVDLSPVEQEVYSAWLAQAKPYDVHVLLRHARRGRLPTTQTFQAVTDALADKDDRELP